ncbi:MAG: hypothetical protein HY690_09140 [Chloroflexi bacterium]|nr:hypothetical protein [Chloroflexota bacterium]
MARTVSAWQRFVGEMQRQLPRTATPQERAQAMRKAAAEWRARKAGHAAQNPLEAPRHSKLIAVTAGLGALGYLAWRRIRPPAPPSPQPQP